MLKHLTKTSGCGVESITVSDLPVYRNIPFGSYQPEWTNFLKTHIYPSIFGWNFRKVTYLLPSIRNFRNFLSNGKHPCPTGGLPVVLPARWRHAERRLPEPSEVPTSLRDIYKFVAHWSHSEAETRVVIRSCIIQLWRLGAFLGCQAMLLQVRMRRCTIMEFIEKCVSLRLSTVKTLLSLKSVHLCIYVTPMQTDNEFVLSPPIDVTD